MDPRLSSLLELQRALSAQRELEREFEEIPRRRQEILTYLNHLKEEASRAEERYKKYEVEQRTVELEIQEGQSARVKKEAQLLTIKNNKEYQATVVEIESLDRRNTRSEERLIEVMDRVEKERKLFEQKRKEMEERESALQSELTVLEEREKGLTARVNEARQETEQLRFTIQPELYNRFIRVFDGKQGVAVATANGNHCSACNIRLTPRLVQLAKRGQDIVVCEACQRFLYWDHSLDDDQLTSL